MEFNSQSQNSGADSKKNLILSLGNQITIKGFNPIFTVKGIIRFSSSDGSQWSEYMVVNDNGTELWLTVQEDQVSFYQILDSKPDLSAYTCIEDNTEYVSYAAGDVDVENGDYAKFKDYLCTSDNTLISVEEWDDETEYSQGRYIDFSDVTVVGTSTYVSRQSNLSSYSGNSSRTTDDKIKKYTASGCIIILLLLCLVGLFQSNDAISNFIQTHNPLYFQVKTSVSVDKDKAIIYEVDTLISLDSLAMTMLEELGDNIKETHGINEISTNVVAMNSLDEFCLLYLSNKNERLAFFCEKKFLEKHSDEPLYNADTTVENFYHSYVSKYILSHPSSYHSSYGYYYFRDDDRYRTRYNSLYTKRQREYSARQSSSGSRRSGGGGHGGGGK